MKIGISGANGQLGKSALQQLKQLAGDHEIIGISRAPNNIKLADKVRFGDYDQPESLADAYAGLDRLLIIPSIDIGYGARARQLVAAIDGALAAGVGHIILISDVGTCDEPEPRVGAASWAAEQRLIKTAPSWTIIRANYFMESYAQEVLLWQNVKRLPELGEHRIGFVSRDDVAHAAAAVLAQEGHKGAIYNATGPAALSVAERAELIASVMGTAVDIVKTSIDGLRHELNLAGFPEDYLDIVLDTKRKAASSGFDIVTGDVEHLTGENPASLKDVMARTISALTS